MNQLSKKLLNVKSAYQQIQEDYDKQQRKLHQQNNQALDYQTQIKIGKLKNEKLKEDCRVSERSLIIICAYLLTRVCVVVATFWTSEKP